MEKRDQNHLSSISIFVPEICMKLTPHIFSIGTPDSMYLSYIGNIFYCMCHIMMIGRWSQFGNLNLTKKKNVNKTKIISRDENVSWVMVKSSKPYT